MKRRHPPHIPLRRPIYVGCEGDSEVGYVALLREFALAAKLPVHIKIEDLGQGAGDPLARIEKAILRIDLLRAKRVAPAAKFVLLDSDQTDREPQRAERARHLAEEHDITIIWQQPCFEAVLLRHIVGRATHRPPDTPGALRALKREWPDYEKPMGRLALAPLLDLDAIQRAAAVEPELASLLREIGLLI